MLVFELFVRNYGLMQNVTLIGEMQWQPPEHVTNFPVSSLRTKKVKEQDRQDQEKNIYLESNTEHGNNNQSTIRISGHSTLCVSARACVCVCARVFVRARVCLCVRARVFVAYINVDRQLNQVNKGLPN